MGRPTHRVSVLIDGNPTWHNVGVAWLNKKGALNVKLNPLVDLSRMTSRDKLYLFPNTTDVPKDPGLDPADPGFDAATPDTPAEPSYVPYPDDDDIPF